MRERGGSSSTGCTKKPRLWMIARVGAAYACELRRGDEILSTGRLTAEQELAPGDEMKVAVIVAHVEALSWANGERRLMLDRLLV